MKQLPKIKICGMRDVSNIREVASLAPDFMGFIFYKPSPRFVGEEFILPVNFPESIKKVGVFVNEKQEEVVRIIAKYSLDVVQLHGDESVEYCQEVKSTKVEVIKVFRVDQLFDFAVTIPYQPMVDYFLFDTKGKYFGGNAAVFDWSLLKEYNQRTPFFLSGGLKASNLERMDDLQSLNLFGLDINSGVEDSPGFKNIDKIKQLLNQIRL